MLALGVLAAGVTQLCVQVPALYKTRLLARGERFSTSEKRSGALGVLKRSAPLALGAAVYQVNVMIDGLMAEGLLTDGGPTLHYYAGRLQQFPMALIAVAATSAVFPALKALGHRGERGDLRGLHDKTQLAISFVALPASFALFALAIPIVSVSFERGAFTAEGVERTASALRGLSLAILPAGAVGLVARTYYALGDFSTPVRVSIIALAVNVVLNVFFIVGLQMDVSGLAWATTLTSWGNLAMLLPGLRKRELLPASSERWFERIAPQVVCALACAGAAFGVHFFVFEAKNSFVGLGVSVAIGLVVFGVFANLLNVNEWRNLKSRLGRFSKSE